MKRGILAALTAGTLSLLAAAATAQQFEQVDDVQIHYSAVSTSFLPEAVAREHRIQRNPALALLNVSVLEEQADGTTRSVPATVDGRVGEVGDEEGEPLSFRTLRIGDTPSQVAVFRIRDDAPMRFDLEVRHDRNAEPAHVSFIQRFYIDR
ncbi:protein of unknown function [Halomonas shengliensis]|uniref:DUF4426 domain-containing protein n=1 Tax=Halomonas shengliensis TaxID=419597 RepID=A0A1H0JQV9_9GAMM|nr:DUF4426 domain-containing protein [Halomonas shengliensis]SDO45801.1 protein of unknown function [Halomonas shengliensis]